MENDLAVYYARRAREYEAIYAKPERQEELAALRDRMRALLAGRNVLELACGTGYWTAVAAESARSVRGCDINDEVLGVARAKGLDPARVTFERGDAYAPPAATGCDAGLAAFWWSHVPRARLPAFLGSFHRALAPGARLVFVDNVFAPGSSTPIGRKDAAGDTWQLRRLNDGSAHEVLKNFPSEAELRAVVAGPAGEIAITFGRYYWLMTYRLA